jgi:hypothetical protein
MLQIALLQILKRHTLSPSLPNTQQQAE